MLEVIISDYFEVCNLNVYGVTILRVVSLGDCYLCRFNLIMYSGFICGMRSVYEFFTRVAVNGNPLEVFSFTSYVPVCRLLMTE